MSKQKMYFLNEHANVCYPLSYHLQNAKEENLTEIELIDAIPDKLNKDIVWCTELENTATKSECNKSCLYYKSFKGHICDFRGRLMDFGNNVKFDVQTGTRNRI